MNFGRLLKGVFSASSQLFKNAASQCHTSATRLGYGALGLHRPNIWGSLSRTLVTLRQPQPFGTTGQVMQNKSRLLLVSNPAPVVQPVRTKVYFNRRNGGPRAVKAVLKRFFRLSNGLWIRTRAGRAKKRWAKRPARLNRLDQHVFCNGTQCRLLDRMVTRSWKEKKYYPNDPYAPYHRLSHNPNYTFLQNKPRFVP